MRFPLMMAPLPEISLGSCFVHGRATSGWRTVENTFTTEFSTAGDGVSADAVEGAGLTDPEGAGDEGSSGETGEPAGAGAAGAAHTVKIQRTDKTAPNARDRTCTTRERFMRKPNITAPAKARLISPSPPLKPNYAVNIAAENSHLKFTSPLSLRFPLQLLRRPAQHFARKVARPTRLPMQLIEGAVHCRFDTRGRPALLTFPHEHVFETRDHSIDSVSGIDFEIACLVLDRTVDIDHFLTV